MNRLEQLIKELCPDGVEWVRLKDCCIMKKGKSLTKKNAVAGEYPVISGGREPAFYCNQFNSDGEIITVAGSGAGAGYVQYWNKKIFVCDAFSVKPAGEDLTKYIFYCLQNIQAKIYETKTTGGIPHVYISSIENFRIPLPPIEIQAEIVRMLDSFTELSALLNAELSAKRKQYAYYRDMLLDFGDEVEWKTLGEIAEISTGNHNTNEELEIGDYPFFVRSQEARRLNQYDFDETAVITSGDGVGVGKIFHYINGKYALHQRAYRIHIVNKNILPKFYYYYMKSTFLNYIEKNAVNSSVTSIRRPMLNNYPVPIPPIEEQERIVAILDKFDSLCNDLTEGLPAEIEARRKQYEYYRDKLLSFREKQCAD